jgi:hypothetical protein
MPLHTATVQARATATATDSALTGLDPDQQRRALTLCLGSLPPDMNDCEINAVIIAAAGGSRAELTALLGHENAQSTTNWKGNRANIIQQARLGFGTLLSGVARLQLTELLLAGLESAREVIRTPSDNPERRLATLARASRDLQSVCEYLDRRAQADSHSDRLGVDPYAVQPSTANSLQRNALALRELVADAHDTPCDSVVQ